MFSKKNAKLILYCCLFLINLLMFYDISFTVGEYKCVNRYGLGFHVVKQCAHFHNQRSNHVLFTFLPLMVVQYCLFLDFWLNAEKIFTKKRKESQK